MKKLIFVNGTMGAGKTTTCTLLMKQLENSVFLDGDWCWNMHPLIVNEETKAMVLDNITHLLRNFLACSAHEYVIFCWVMHEQQILDDILNRLDLTSCEVYCFSLILHADSLRAHFEKDIQNGLRTSASIETAIARLSNYDRMKTQKIDVSDISAQEAVNQILDRIQK